MVDVSDKTSLEMSETLFRRPTAAKRANVDISGDDRRRRDYRTCLDYRTGLDHRNGDQHHGHVRAFLDRHPNDPDRSRPQAAERIRSAVRRPPEAVLPSQTG
jgi:hypothetical protein